MVYVLQDLDGTLLRILGHWRRIGYLEVDKDSCVGSLPRKYRREQEEREISLDPHIRESRMRVRWGEK